MQIMFRDIICIINNSSIDALTMQGKSRQNLMKEVGGYKIYLIHAKCNIFPFLSFCLKVAYTY